MNGGERTTNQVEWLGQAAGWQNDWGAKAMGERALMPGKQASFRGDPVIKRCRMQLACSWGLELVCVYLHPRRDAQPFKTRECKSAVG